MANYSQVSYGSKGNDVTELQKLLNQNGYNLSVDGDFGSKTQAAVKDYQQKNNLAVDGIVGANTWGALTKAQSSSGSSSSGNATAAAPAEPSAPTFSYTPSDTVSQAEALLQQQLAQKPGEYQSTWKDQLNDKISQILNRDKFSYDPTKDAMYQYYADQYTTQGKLASMDVMGQAAAMTGGYGNSYAQAAGQQAYQSYLQKLNEVVPELYGMAQDQYNQEGQALYDQASLMAQMEDQDYGRYRDQLNDYYTELSRLTEDARYMSETEYQKALDEFNIKYGAYRDTVSDQQWQAQFDEAKRQYDEQMALSTSKSSGSSTGSRSSGSTQTGSGYDNGGVPEANIIAMQNALGVTPDGKWGPNTQAAAQKQWGTSSAATAWETKGKNLGGGDTPVDTENTKLFRSSIMTSTEFARRGNKATVRGKTYTSYKSYIEAVLADWTDNDVPYIGKNLTDAEVSFLMDYYGL